MNIDTVIVRQIMEKVGVDLDTISAELTKTVNTKVKVEVLQQLEVRAPQLAKLFIDQLATELKNLENIFDDSLWDIGAAIEGAVKPIIVKTIKDKFKELK